MKITKLFTRSYNKEEYIFYKLVPEYAGEKGILGIEVEPYIKVITPENGLGYTDTVLLDSSSKKAYTLNRYLPKWILKKIEIAMLKEEEKIWNEIIENGGIK